MRLFSWLHNRVTGRNHTKCTANRRLARRFRPQLEVLEGREVPSTLTVTNNLDDGSAGSLRGEIAAAQSGDTIVFSPNLLNTIYVTNGELVINKNLTIQGPGAGSLTISAYSGLAGGSDSRLFEVDGASTTVSLSGLTISDGSANSYGPNAGEGGAILNFGLLTVSNCTLSNNSAGPGYYYVNEGGAIYNSGTLTVSNCTLSNNSAGFSGTFAQIAGDGGAIFNTGTLTVSNSLLFSNHAYNSYPNSNDGFGGAIYNGFNATATLTACRLWSNTAEDGAGIWNDGAMTLSDSSVTGDYAYRHGNDIYNGRAGFIRIESSNIGFIYNDGGHVQLKK